MKHKILGMAVLLCAVFLAACSDLVDELTPKETYYRMEISSDIENGEVSADKASARAGDTVKLTLSANEGYRFSELTVTGANNAAVPVTAIKTGEVYTFTMPASAVKISAAFIPIPTYKVTFSTDGGTETAEQTVEENGRAERPSDPAKDGFTFAGWYTSADGGATLSETVFDFNTPITADITLYAKWIDATVPVYKVTIADGIESGTVSASADTAAEGAIITLTAAPASGYTLSAYSVKDAEENPVSVTTGGTFTMPASNVTVYATFTELPPDAANYTVKHLFQKVDASGYEQNTSDYPDEIKAGTVGGQTEASAKTVNGFTAIFIQKTIEADGSTVVEIKYDRNSNIVTYEDGTDDDIAVPEGTFYRYGQTVTVSFTGIGARPGYLFTGWKQGDATYTSDGDTSFTMGDSPVTLTAQWTKIGTTFAVTISESTGDFSLESAADGTKLTFTAVGTDSGANLVWKVYKDNTALADAAYKQSGPDTAFSFDTGSLKAGNYTLFVTSGTRSAAAVFTVPEPIATLKTGSEINAILNTFGKTTITQFAKSGTNSEGATEYLDIDEKIPVWLDGTVVYYYVPDGTTVYMNEDSAEMFRGCYKLTSLEVTGFDTSKVENMSGMFYDCLALTSLEVTGFDMSNVTNMSEMFYYCSNLTELDVSKFDTSKVTNMSGMFTGCSGLTSLDVSKFVTSNVKGMKNMFSSCSKLTSLDVSKFDTGNVTNMSGMFKECSKLESLTLSYRFDTSKVTDMSSMFFKCSKLASLDLSSFNTGSVTDMASMFFQCEGFESLDVSKFGTSAVTNMRCMFFGCSALKELDLSSFNTSAVTDMYSMFCGCSKLTKLNVNSFDTSAVTDMYSMFQKCSALTELDVSNFDTSAVELMREMFSSCSALTSLDLSSFNTSKVHNMYEMFSYCSNLTTIYATAQFVTYDQIYGTWCFKECTNLKGGAGTTYDSSKVDAHPYARIDGGNSAPGYFTLKPIGSKSKPDAVGDIVFNDGSATPYTADLTFTEEQKAAAIAVIFYVGTECSNDSASRTLGVGLAQNQSGLAWCLSSANACNVNITTIQESDKDGSDNLSQIGEFLGENDDTDTADKYPAFYFAENYASQTGSNVSGTDYADGWYLPAKAELQKIYDNRSNVNKGLAACGGTTFNASVIYWSSSQYASNDGKAYKLGFRSGAWGNSYKSFNDDAVCAVRAFN